MLERLRLLEDPDCQCNTIQTYASHDKGYSGDRGYPGDAALFIVLQICLERLQDWYDIPESQVEVVQPEFRFY